MILASGVFTRRGYFGCETGPARVPAACPSSLALLVDPLNKLHSFDYMIELSHIYAVIESESLIWIIIVASKEF